MEKLINLLNEYEEKENLNMYEWEIEGEDILAYSKFRDGYETINVGESIIISKWYEFIKRLVENNKIDIGEKLFNLTKNDNRKSMICDLDNNDFSWEDTFLMLLSISDTPIEDLISYLK